MGGLEPRNEETKNMNLTSKPQKWAVLGGGILGMTLALRLRQQGH